MGFNSVFKGLIPLRMRSLSHKSCREREKTIYVQ